MATLNVPGTYPSISAAVAAAKPGDKIVIASTYDGRDIVEVTVDNLSFEAPSNVEGISLEPGDTVSKITVLGASPIAIRAGFRASNSQTFVGNDGDNLFNSGGGIDTLDGKGGNDTFMFEGGSNVGGTLDGGIGRDTVLAGDLGSYTFSNVEVLELRNDSVFATAAQLRSFGGLVGQSDGGIITVYLRGDAPTIDFTGKVAGSAPVRVYGNDLTSGLHLTGTAYADLLHGSKFDDVLNGGEGNDTISEDSSHRSEGTDTLNGGGDDTFRIFTPVESFDPNEKDGTLGGRIDGGSGTDTVQAYHLRDFAFRNVEVLEAGSTWDRSVTGTITQLSSFGRIVERDDTENDGKIDITLRGQGGTIDFSHRLAAGGSVNLDGTVLTSGFKAIGGDNADRFYGSERDDVLDGGGGADTLRGGHGNDTYVTDARGSDTIVEDAGAGNDTVESSVSIGLVANLENLTLTGSFGIDGRGNGLANMIVGNGAANSLDGEGGADMLVGAGGADRLAGGDGNDTYLTDGLDTIDEFFREGTDVVQSAGSITLGANLENLILTGDGAIDGTGNDLANTITGNGAANRLDGRYGADLLIGAGGADTLVGGYGNDIYVADGFDTIVENAGAGTDVVQSTGSSILAANLEHLTLTGYGSIGGTGNGLANTITGNGAANRLDGKGGADTLIGAGGKDKLIGGLGNDLYITDGRDTIAESAGGGNDLVRSSASLTLAANVENLTLTGKKSFDATGNGSANVITGNTGANALDGKLGADTLIGGVGDDTFVFSTKLGSGNVDHVVRFLTGHDELALSKSVFKGLGSGRLDEDAFKDVASERVDADDRILYNHKTGKLSYDVDGSGAAKAVQFAVLDKHPVLDAHDILLV